MTRGALDRVDESAAPRRCDYPSCDQEGAYRAPKSRATLREYYWFCLDHVRRYNAAWDYFADMSQAEIEAFQRNNSFGHRPTWRFGMHGRGRGAGGSDVDDYGLMPEDLGIFACNGGDGQAQRPFKPGELQALALLNLEAPVALKEIKDRYKELVKRHHPDTNGGDRTAEERLKKIIQAYTHLLSCGYS